MVVRNGHVKVNGLVALLGEQADPIKDKITVNGHLIPQAEEKVYVMLNKPLGYTCTNRRFANEKNIFDLVQLPYRLFAVGRLDKDSRGLILLTNDGDLTLKLSHPRYEHEKEYEVTTQELPTDSQLDHLRTGVEIATGTTFPAQVKQRDGKVRITIHEGKKRQVRRMFSTVGLTVSNLKRIRINKLLLPANLNPGNFKLIKKEEIL